MAIPILVDTLPQIGVFFPLTSQNTKLAANVNAEDVAKPGVLATSIYAVFYSVVKDNTLWLLLKSATRGKNEWARADLPGTAKTWGEFVPFMQDNSGPR